MNMYSGPDGEPSSFACGYPRWTFIVVATAVLTYINYRGLEFVGQAATFICVFTLLPFIVFCIVGIPQMDASKLLATPPGGIAGVNWRLLLNTFFWNINYWESAASYSGDVEDPGRNYPLGLMIAVVLVALSLILPLVVAIGASALPYDQWADGSFAGIAMEIAGPWLGHWMMAASAVTNIGMFEAEMSSDAWQVAGMADRGILPKFLSSRNKFGAPTFGIALSATGVLCLAWLSFEEVMTDSMVSIFEPIIPNVGFYDLQIVDILNLLFCLGQIIEFLAFLELRRSHEHLHRPFRIPVGLLGACVLMTLPLVFIGIILYFSTPQTLVLAGVCSVLGVVVYYLLEVARQREWVEFCPLQELSYSTSQKSLLYTQSPSASCRASAPSIAGGFQCDSYGAMDALRALSEGNKSTSAAAHSDCLHSETETSPLLP
jgi:amino acid transporter